MDLGSLTSDVSLVSSIAIILGTVFVVVQIRQNNSLIRAAAEQVAFFQIGALFESLGVLVERGIVKLDITEDMFLTRLAWESMKPFVSGVRERYGEEESYVAFERLYERLTRN